MNGIFPDYIGPTAEAKYASLYPDWVSPGEFEVVIEQGGGGSSKKKAEDLRSTRLGRQLLREDEEILAIVMVAMRTLQ